jgi:N6-adenosine-specific RNA methylase IME4
VVRAWGFTPQSEMVWRKLTASGKPRMGTGYRVRTLHEPILVATIGHPTHKPLPSLFDGVAREHSRKPDEFYGIVTGHTPAALRRADLFARETRPGFDGWGNEIGKFDAGVQTIAAGDRVE